MVKGPRPEVKIAGVLTIVGALVAVLGVFLPWVNGGSDILNDSSSVNGLGYLISQESAEAYEAIGVLPLVAGAIALGLGITLFIAGRVLAVAIITIVVGAITVLIGIGVIGLAVETVDFRNDVSFDGDEAGLGIGAILQPIGPLLVLAGGIVATSKRRKMVPAQPAPPPPGWPPQGAPGPGGPSW